MREAKIKIEKVAGTTIPGDNRDVLEKLRDSLGDEMFTEITGIPSGPIANLEKIDPKIIPSLTKSFDEHMKSLEKIDVIDIIPENKKEIAIKQKENVVGKKTEDILRL